MLAYSHIYNDNSDPLDKIFSLKRGYQRAYQIAIKSAGQWAGELIAIPAIIYLKIGVKPKVRQLVAVDYLTVFSNLSNANYRTLRLQLDKNRDRLSHFASLKKVDFNKTGPFSKYLIKEFISVVDMLIDVDLKIDDVLNQVYSTKAKGKHFKPVSEKERWQSRNKIANYQF